MNTLLKTILITAMLLAMSAPAQAMTDQEHAIAWEAAIKQSQPATDGFLWSALAVADRYWGPAPCGPARLHTYRDPGTDWNASARPGECDIYLDRRWLRNVRTGMRWGERYAWEWACVTITHERGHTIGHGHADTGIMFPDLAKIRVPACTAWARAQHHQYVTSPRQRGARAKSRRVEW